MNQSINPYVSPRDAAEDAEQLPPERTVVARFAVGPAWRKEAARAYRLNHVWQLTASLIPVLACMGLGIVLPGDIWDRVSRLWIGFGVGAVASVAVHVWRERAIFAGNRRRLAEHPVLGADGDWRLELDPAALRIATARGQYAAPLEDVRRFQLSGRPLVLWLPGDMPIILLREADYGDETYATVEQAVQARVKSILR